MEAFIYLFIFSCNLTVHFVKFFKSFTIEGIQNIISILSLFISWDGWLYKGPGRVRFQGEVEVLFGFSYFMYVTCCRLSNFSAHFAGNERFYLHFQVLSGYALNKQTGHSRGRDLGARSIFSLPWVVRSINVQYLPHPQRDTSPKYNVLINQSDSEVKLKQINNGQDFIILWRFLWALKLGLSWVCTLKFVLY